jgi:hypothetical protein
MAAFLEFSLLVAQKGLAVSFVFLKTLADEIWGMLLRKMVCCIVECKNCLPKPVKREKICECVIAVRNVGVFSWMVCMFS